MKKLILILTICLCFVSNSSAKGCYSMIVSDVSPDHPNCVRHITTTCCEGNCTVVTTYECY